MKKFTKKLSLLTVLLCMTFGAFAPLLAQDNTPPAKNQIKPEATIERIISEYYEAPAQVEQGSRATQTIFSDGFEGDLTGWITENLGTGGNWAVVSSDDVNGDYSPNSGTYGAANFWNSGKARNAWLHTPGIDLTAGTTYTISFYLSLPGYPTWGEHDYFEAKIGQAQSAAAMTTELYRNTTTYVSSWTKIEQTFTPTTTGTYYLGFHAFTPTDEGDIISIDDILVTTEDGTLPPVEAGEVVATQVDANTVHLAWEPETTDGLTGYEIYRRDCYDTDWTDAELIAGDISAVQTQYMDYTWGTADYGVYSWGVFALYGTDPTAIYTSNCLDKDMLTEVDVTVTLNSGEAATGTVVTFTNTSEPDLDLVYEATLPATGKFAWDEFRKGTYDISVEFWGFETIDETAVLIEDEASFVWTLEEILAPALNLYVTPTALATWKPTFGFKGYAEDFNAGIPSTWTVENNGNMPVAAWTAKTTYGTSSTLDGTPFVMADSDLAGIGSRCDELLISPVINVATAADLYLSFIQYYRHLGSTFSKVEVYDGAKWVTVLNQTATTGTWTTPNVKEIDVTDYINSEFQVRFHYTGNWAYYWAIDDFRLTTNPVRGLEQYKVYLDGIFIANTTDLFYQFDVTNLVAGDTYYAEIMVDYTTGQSAKVGYQFVYEGCDAYDAPTALAAEQPIGTKNAVLTWTNPDLTDVDFLRIYRNGTLYRDNLSMDTPFSAWTDVTLDNGTYNYALQLVYDDGAETCMDAATKSITIVSTGTIKGAVTYQLGGNVQGATITVSNTDKTYTFTTAANGTYSGTVEAGTYAVKCEMEGHVSQTANATVLYVGTTTVDFGLYETPVAVEGVTATLQDNGTVYVAWDGSTGGGGGGGGTTGETFEEGFEAGNIPTGWVVYDVDNDGYNWENTAVTYSTFDAHTGNYCMTSASYVNYVGALTPNNYLVTPALALGSGSSELKFWVDGQDSQGYHNEKYYVKVSTTGNAVADFTTTLHTATSTADWAEITVDLSAYAGQTIYLAFVHADVTDQYFLKLDDVSITNVTNRASKANETLAAPKLSAKDYANSFRTSGMNTSDIEIASVKAMDRAAEARAFALTQPQTIVESPKATRGLVGYNVYRNDCYGGTPELLASLPTTVTNFYDNNWSDLDFGVYKWGVEAVYDLNVSEIVYSNCIDKDMYTEVSVTVNLNTAESPEGTKVMFTNISEPDMELVYEIELDETGYFLFEEFRKGEYDILVTKFGYEPLEIAAEEIVEATDFVWVLEELIEPALDLYVSPTGYAMWEVPAPEVFEGFYESFDEGIPAEWTVTNNGHAMSKWQVVSNYSGGSLNGSPFAFSDSDAGGVSSTADETLTSPVIDASICGELYLSFVQYYRHLGSAAYTSVEVYDGSAWVEVLKQTATVASWTAPNAQEIDVTPYINENLQVRFYYKANWAYYWAIDDVMLSETPAKDRAVQYSKVWLDGIFCADVAGTTYQHDVTNLVEDQEYTTEVAVMYTTGLSEKVSYTWTYTPCENYPGATTFTAELEGENAKLNWVLPGGTVPPPPGETHELQYCADANDDAIGLTNNTNPQPSYSFEVAMRFDATDIADYAGWKLIDISMYLHDAPMNASLKAWTGANAATTILEQSISGFTTTAWQTYAVTGNAVIESGKEFWVGYSLTNAHGARPAGIDAGPAVVGKGDMVYMNNAWITLTSAGISANWQIKATIESPSGKQAVITKNQVLPQAQYDNGNSELALSGIIIDRSNSQSEVAPSFGYTGEASRAQWDLVKEFNLNAGGEQGIATDGEYIYTAFWGTAGKFSKYEMDGTYIEDFTISGGGATRDITYDGEYFYGSAGSTTIYKYDFANKTLVGTISSAKTARHISYDPETGGFYVGDWSDLSLISSTGSLVSTCPAPNSAYGSAYYAPSDGSGPYLFLNTQGGGYGTANVYTYDISSNTMSSTYVNVAASMTGIDPTAAIAGGAFVANYDGKLCFFSNIQQTPNKVGIFELEEEVVPPPPPPAPIIGVNIYRNGEFLAFVAEGTNTYTDENIAYGEHEYCIQVVYDNYAMSCIDNMLCDDVFKDYPCEAPTNLAGEYVEADGVFGGYVTWGSIPAEPIFEDVESHTAFTVNSPGSIGWSYIDGDASSTYGFNGISFENTGGAMSFIVFDPKLTTPEMYTSTPTIHAHSGDKFFASFAATSAPNNDWIISPELSGATKISFWAKSYMSDYGLERFKVSYSTTNASQGSFTVLSTGSYVEAPLDWTFYQYDIPSGAKYVAITCVSNDAFIFMLDDISIEVGGKSITLDAEDFNTTVVSNEPVSAIAQRSILSDEQIAKYAQPVVDNSPQVTRNIQGYNVYRALIETKDYSLIATVPFEEGITEYFYYDTNVLAQETYDYQVTAVYVYEDGYECESEAALTPEGDDHVSIFMDYGIEDHNTDSRIYPNPASNYITVEATNMNRITVMSVVGQVVYDVKVDSNQERINVSNLKSGVYVVRISSEAGVSSERITIVR